MRFAPPGIALAMVAAAVAAFGDATAQSVADRINLHRKVAGLAPVTVDPALNAACEAHAQYLILHDGKVWSRSQDRIDPHDEGKTLAGYSDEGRKAARSSIIAWVEPVLAIDNHMEGHFHRVPILNPDLQRIGAGIARGGKYGWAVVIDVTGGVGRAADRPLAVIWPGDGQQNVPIQYYKEMPDPIPDDPDKVAGNPVTASFPLGKKVLGANATLVEGKEGKGAKPVEFWLSTPEKPSDAIFQRNTVCLFPKDPLKTKTLYTATVEATVDGQPWKKTWSFTTSSERPKTRPH